MPRSHRPRSGIWRDDQSQGPSTVEDTVQDRRWPCEWADIVDTIIDVIDASTVPR